MFFSRVVLHSANTTIASKAEKAVATTFSLDPRIQELLLEPSVMVMFMFSRESK